MAKDGWSKKYVCSGKGNGEKGCGARILISEFDVYETRSCLGLEVKRHSTFCCPRCGAETDIELPPGKIMRGIRPMKKERKMIGLTNLKSD